MESVERAESFDELVSQAEKVQNIPGGICQSRVAQRTNGPVRALDALFFRYFNSHEVLQSRGESETLTSHEGCGNARVEEVSNVESPVTVEASNVVVAGVQHGLDGGVRQDLAQGTHVVDGKRVYQVDAPRSE